ncbi:formimidoylglutamate deiminase [Rhodanobacter sp. C03]|uniref:formimidoylglutamate deiminase n=1 Tax=Rhodanobacter sp. C03 TaxID=1945858 RepID=UPI00098694EE|nr:formimidoylglutamate deiminase [Rhodanobacter sp. C03]OOG57196.1 formimidoylglutamate deiminase [Rhodanobacter sp. C03]
MSDSAAIRSFKAGQLWQPGGWHADAMLGVDAGGRLVEPAVTSAEPLGAWILPGMPNLHSHAFQRAMAGLAERKGRVDDSFWSWRETMYAFAAAIGPDELKAIAAQLYVEMLKAGYTQVCEFHYLHHQPDGTPYAQLETMSLALIEAAREAGIALTLLPVLYISGGFDGRALTARQRRFGHTVDGYLRLLETLRRHESDDVRVGIALHSLRAVPEQAMREVLASDMAKTRPIHIHIAEQIGEVQDCLATRGARPVEWLFDHADVDSRWCLVHATHLTEAETLQIARSGAVAGLCPTTEANLGDGLFPLAAYQDAGGTLGIGSDSHISISPVEELRWLEYGQRLQTRHRNIAARHEGDSVGETLWRAALRGGAQAAGLPVGELRGGARADLIVLDDNSPLLAARDTCSVLDSLLFAGNTPLVRDVMVGSHWQVRDFHHHDEERIAARYRVVVARLAGV